MLLSRKVIASNITNLTDARYFAARGVDYLLFDLADISLDKVVEIKEWVSGPEILVLLDKTTLPLLDECMIKVEPKGVGSRAQEIIAELGHMESFTDLFVYQADGGIHLDEISFLPVEHKDQLAGLSDDHGIIIVGGSEVEVGVKSFEDLDEILDEID